MLTLPEAISRIEAAIKEGLRLDAEATPSPWEESQFTMVVCHDIRKRIADVSGRSAEERAANSRLIASYRNHTPAFLRAMLMMIEIQKYVWITYPNIWNKECAALIELAESLPEVKEGN